MKARILAAISVLMLTGCGGLKPQRGGQARHTSPTGAVSEMRQPENPKDAATQRTEAAKQEERSFPPGATVRETETKAANGQTNVITREFIVPTNAPAAIVIKSTVSDKSQTAIGGSFADAARELAERVKSVRPVMYFGILMLAAAAALAYFQWWTKAAIAAGIGIGSIILAQVLPGHEGIIMLAALAVFALLALLVLYVYHKGKLDLHLDQLAKAR